MSRRTGSKKAASKQPAAKEAPEEAKSASARRAPDSGKRRQSREMALQMLFQWDQTQAMAETGLASNYLAQIFRRFDLHLYGTETSTRTLPAGSVEAFRHARELVEGTISQLEEIDGKIRAQAENWRLERMPVVDRNILRLAIFQFLAEPDVPPIVVIDESIELAKKFGSDQSGAFVNGVLDALRKELDAPPVAAS